MSRMQLASILPLREPKVADAKRKCNRMGMKKPQKAPDFGYCAAQPMYYYGYKLHAVCGVSGVIHSYDLTQASVHDLKYVNDIGQDFVQCTIIGDKGYLSAEVQLNLFESAYIRLEVPYRLNQKNWKPFYKPFGKVRKRVETDKVSAFTVSQYLNSINNRPIGRIKYALA